MTDTSSVLNSDKVPVRSIGSPEDLHAAVRACRDTHVIFRGEDNAAYPLLPKFCRYEGKHRWNTPENERQLLEEFKRRAPAHLSVLPSDDWEWLAIAQHFGLATRYLDWSESPLVATHFAVRDPDLECDRVVYALRYIDMPFAMRNLGQIDTTKISPFDLKEVAIYRPHHIATRITSQSGVFTVHPFSKVPFTHAKLEKWLIEASAVWDVLVMLRMYGIHDASIFPDLDGLSRYLNTKYVFGMLYE